MTAPPSPLYLGPAAHTSSGANKPITRVVIHATVSPCKPGGSHDVARYFRTQAAGGSAHYIVDPTEAVQVVYDSVIAWHAPPNPHSIGVELCDPQKGNPDRWHDDAHKAMLERAAQLVAQLCLAYDVPIKRIRAADLLAGAHGICGHIDVTNAWHKTSHTDPGDGFPWTKFLAMVTAAAKSTPTKPPTLRMRGPKHPHWTKVAQRHLGIPANGVFDAGMKRVVVAYRRKHRIRPYHWGVIGSRVWKLLLKEKP